MSRILLVDDDAMLMPALGEMLTILGHTYTPARHGIEALRFLENNSFDLIITDIVMPFMDGNKFIEAVSKLPEPPPIIVIVGNASKLKPNPLIKEVIAKPVRISIFKGVLQKYLSEPKDYSG